MMSTKVSGIPSQAIVEALRRKRFKRHHAVAKTVVLERLLACL